MRKPFYILGTAVTLSVSVMLTFAACRRNPDSTDSSGSLSSMQQSGLTPNVSDSSDYISSENPNSSHQSNPNQSPQNPGGDGNTSTEIPDSSGETTAKPPVQDDPPEQSHFDAKTLINKNNMGCIIAAAELYYFVDENGDLCAVTSAGTDRTVIAENITGQIAACEGFIYYTDEEHRLFRFAAGSEEQPEDTKITTDMFTVATLSVGDTHTAYIFYRAEREENGKTVYQLHRRKADGTGVELTLLASGCGGRIRVADNTVYLLYQDAISRDKYNLGCIPADGSAGLKNLIQNVNDDFAIYGDFLFYTRHLEDNIIVRCDLEGGNVKTVVEQPGCTGMEIYDGVLYYYGIYENEEFFTFTELDYADIKGDS